MGTWGVGLYQCDDAADLREDFREVVRAPWDGNRLLAWALETYPEAADAGADGYADLRLALADLFWTYGIDQPEVREAGLELVDGGADLESKRRLGMSDRDLKRRAAVLDGLAAKWRSANPKARAREMLRAPQPFLLETGDCFVYPTSEGRVRNPYVSPAKEEWFYKTYPWEREGWAAAIVLHTTHRFATFARYLVAILRYDGEGEPAIDVFPTLSILHSNTFMTTPMRRVHLVSTTREHLKRMGVAVVGNLQVNRTLVESTFAKELARSGREFANDAWTLPDMYSYRPERLAPADVEDPLATFLE
jgi:hypothetical protein